MTFDYAAQAKDPVLTCNLCGALSKDPVECKDRHGFTVGVSRCECGLKYLNPRMTAGAYAKFYNGPYRELVQQASKLQGFDYTPEVLRKGQGRYGLEIAAFMWTEVCDLPLATLLDIGGSTGIVARVLSSVLDLRATVVDPSAGELPADIETIPKLIEHFDDSRQWDLIIMCQSVDHLLDISGTLVKVKRLLAPGGYFFVDIADNAVFPQLKVDHPYYLTAKLMERYLRQAGFRIPRVERAGYHVRYLCR